MPFPPSRLLGEGRHPPAATAPAAAGSGADAGEWGGLPGLGASDGTPLTCKGIATTSGGGSACGAGITGPITTPVSGK